MKFEDLNCINDNINLEDYLYLYKYVRNNMKHPEWLGTFSKSEIIDILAKGGKIWIYYDENNIVCSMFYIPATNKSLIKHNIKNDESITGSIGPMMVSPDYIGKGFQNQMMKVIEMYCKSINKKYIFTKLAAENIYCLNNLLKNDYIIVDKYDNERGLNFALLKQI